uniref:Uncharacterized protein n=1 Tax=Salmo trutta TaxID=8032 RepID=A0A674E1E7_SALTR
IRLFVSLPVQSPGTNRTICPKVCGDTEECSEGSKGNRNSVEAILEESTEKLKNLSLQQQQGSSTSDKPEELRHHATSSTSSPPHPLRNQTPPYPLPLQSTTESWRTGSGRPAGGPTLTGTQFPGEERSDSEVNNDRSTSSVDSDILSSSHSSDTLCNADSGPIQLANGLDSHSITSRPPLQGQRGQERDVGTQPRRTVARTASMMRMGRARRNPITSTSEQNHMHRRTALGKEARNVRLLSA